MTEQSSTTRPAYHPSVGELSDLGVDPSCDWEVTNVENCGAPAVAIAVTKWGQLAPMCAQHVKGVLNHAALIGQDEPRFVTLADLIGLPA